MSKEAVHELLKKAGQDAALRSALETAIGDEKTAVQSFLATAAEHGCEFTAKEFVEVMEQAAETGELGDGELDAVAGGALLSGWSVPKTTLTLFRSYTTSPSISSLGGLSEVEEEEELIQM